MKKKMTKLEKEQGKGQGMIKSMMPKMMMKEERNPLQESGPLASVTNASRRAMMTATLHLGSSARRRVESSTTSALRVTVGMIPTKTLLDHLLKIVIAKRTMKMPVRVVAVSSLMTIATRM